MSGDQIIGFALIVVPGICYLLAILSSSPTAPTSLPAARPRGEFEQLHEQVDAARADFTGDHFSLWDAELTERRSEP